MPRLVFKPGKGWILDDDALVSADGRGGTGATTTTTTMNVQGSAGATAASYAPPGVETNGQFALSWGNPTQITVALGTHTISGQGIAFSNPLPSNAITLLYAAEKAWEAVANVKFVNVDDTGSDTVSAASIRVGLANLSSMGFIGYTTYSWDAGNHFKDGTVVALADVGAGSVTALSNGNARFVGYATTVFQDLLHELGHAIGLEHNPYSAASIMNPTLGPANPYISSQDATALRALYGAPSDAAVSAALSDPTLTKLLPWPSAVTV